MSVVRNQEELERNLVLFENYLADGTVLEQEFAHNFIRRGACFVAYQINSESRFSPSRYSGYLNNSME